MDAEHVEKEAGLGESEKAKKRRKGATKRRHESEKESTVLKRKRICDAEDDTVEKLLLSEVRRTHKRKRRDSEHVTATQVIDKATDIKEEDISTEETVKTSRKKKRHKEKSRKRDPDLEGDGEDIDLPGLRTVSKHPHKQHKQREEEDISTEETVKTSRKKKKRYKEKSRKQEDDLEGDGEDIDLPGLRTVSKHRHKQHKQREEDISTEETVKTSRKKKRHKEKARKQDDDLEGDGEYMDLSGMRTGSRHPHKQHKQREEEDISTEETVKTSRKKKKCRKEKSRKQDDDLEGDGEDIDLSGLKTVSRHPHKQHKQREEDNLSESIDEHDEGVESVLPCKAKPGRDWQKVRNEQLVNYILRGDNEQNTDDEEYYDDDEEAEEQEEEEGVLAELHKEFVTYASDIEKLRERCEGKERERERERELKYVFPGEKYRTGRWSVQEMNLLKNNIRSFIKRHRIVDFHAFVFTKGHEFKRIDMFRYVARGIHRPLFAIYRKVARVLDAENYVGRWTDDMDKKILELQHMHGNKWTTIGKTVGASGAATRDRYRVIHKRRNKGPWSPEEEQLLAAAVAQLRGEDWTGGDAELPDTATWEDVARCVKTRTAIQCWNKWVVKLSWKLEGVQVVWTLPQDVRLIERLSELEVDDEEEVDWMELAKEWPQLAGSNTVTKVRHILRVKWSVLKRSVPMYFTRTFQDNVDYLVQHRLHALKAKACTLSQLQE